MNDLAASLAKLMIGFLSLFGPIALILWILNARDQRESKLFAIVLGELNRPIYGIVYGEGQKLAAQGGYCRSRLLELFTRANVECDRKSFH